MALGRATINLPGGEGEPDLAPGDAVEIAEDHPFVQGGYVVLDAPALDELTRDELAEQAKALGVTGTSGMRKDELQAAITEAEAADGAVVVDTPDGEAPTAGLAG